MESRVVCPFATGWFQLTCDLEVRPRCHAERNVLRFRGRTASGRTCRDHAWLLRCSPLAAGQRPPSGGCDRCCRERQRFGGRLRCPRLRCSVSPSHRGSWLPTSSPLSFPLISRDGRHPDACEMLDATPWVWGADARGVQAFGPLCPPRGRALLWGQPRPSREPSASVHPQLQAAVLVHPLFQHPRARASPAGLLRKGQDRLPGEGPQRWASAQLPALEVPTAGWGATGVPVWA